jgi:uncharacterized protein with PIN domain
MELLSLRDLRVRERNPLIVEFMKFIADSMLGRLARWLRLLGHDTLYFSSIEDRRLLKIAREESRTLLTRDTRLVKMKGLQNFLLLRENDTFQQLKTVITTFDLVPYDQLSKGGFEIPHSIHSRCSLCNSPLADIPLEHVRPFVPDYVYRTSAAMKKCVHCSKFYWKGTHHEKLRKKLREILYN